MSRCRPALEGGARLGAEREGRSRVVGEPGGTGVDSYDRRDGVDRPGRGCGSRIVCSRPDRSRGLRMCGSRRRGRQYACGEVQGPHSPASRRHWKEATPEPGCQCPQKVNDALGVPLWAGGPELIEVVGAVVSTVQVDARRASRRRCRPGRSPGLRICGCRRREPVRFRGEVQARQSAAWVESIRHWNEATPDPPGSAPEKLKARTGRSWSEPAARSRSEVVGAVVSTVQVEDGRARIEISGLVDRPDFEFVIAVSEGGEVPRRSAALPVGGLGRVEPALEGGDARAAGIGATEKVKLAETRCTQRRRSRVDLGRRSGRVDRPGALAGLASAFPAWSIARTSNL